jgi:thiamine pyrophosphate-dependent acetolactate synthase large subunit-like protein
MNRAAATKLLTDRLTNEVVVTNLGETTIDMQQLGDRLLNCYTFGSMGQCSSIALGIALARPDTRVFSLDGDGSLLMNLGVLCTIAIQAPGNLAVVVWDNEVYQTTGGQLTATAHGANFAGIARGAGIQKVLEPRNESELGQAFDRMLNEDGPFFVNVKVDKGPAAGRLQRDVISYKLRFMKAIEELPPDRPKTSRVAAVRS